MKGAEAYFEQEPFLDRAYERAQKVLGNSEINPRAFNGLYPKEIIDRDLQMVERRKREFAADATPEEREDQRLAYIFEAMFHDGLAKGDWLGNGAHAIKPSRFDDIVNGVDSVVEFQEGLAVEQNGKSASYLALAMDVTFGARVEDKLRRIKNVEIGEEQLTSIKYFESQYLGGQLELAGIPRVVVGADRRAVRQLIDVWLSGDEKALREHPLHKMVLEEIRMQLEVFEAYSRAGEHDAESAVYHEMRVLIDNIIRRKKVQADIPRFRQDKVFEGIFQFLRNFI